MRSLKLASQYLSTAVCRTPLVAQRATYTRSARGPPLGFGSALVVGAVWRATRPLLICEVDIGAEAMWELSEKMLQVLRSSCKDRRLNPHLTPQLVLKVYAADSAP